jgi:hypothetical protein
MGSAVDPDWYVLYMYSCYYFDFRPSLIESRTNFLIAYFPVCMDLAACNRCLARSALVSRLCPGLACCVCGLQGGIAHGIMAADVSQTQSYHLGVHG